MEFVVHVRPGARRSAVDGTHDGVLALRVAAPPVDGRANRAVMEVLVQAFGVAKRDVTIVGGATGRRKRVRITGDDDALVETLNRLMGR